MRNRKALEAFWCDERRTGMPHEYAQPVDRSEMILNYIKHLPKDISICELGTNVGRNINHLYQAGYHNIEGVEVAEQPIKVMNEIYDVKWKMYNMSIEKFFQKSRHYDLIFTMAVLMHIPKESEWIFHRIADSSKYLLTIENETTNGIYRKARDYSKIFHSKRLFRTETDNRLPGYTIRMFY